MYIIPWGYMYNTDVVSILTVKRYHRVIVNVHQLTFD